MQGGCRVNCGGLRRQSRHHLLAWWDHSRGDRRPSWEDLLAGTDDQSPSSQVSSPNITPRTPLVISADPISPSHDERIGLLTLSEESEIDSLSPYSKVEFLSPEGSLTEAAANLFAAMRRLDAAELDRIIARPVPETNLGPHHGSPPKGLRPINP